MFAFTTLRILLLVVSLWMAKGKPAEPSESVSGRGSRQLFLLPYYAPWPEPPQYSSYQNYYGYNSVMDTVHPATQQQLMEALLAATVSKGEIQTLFDGAGFNSTNLSQSKNTSSGLNSKNQGQSPSPIMDFSQNEFIQLQARPDIQGFVNQTIQMIVTAVVQAVLAQLAG